MSVSPSPFGTDSEGKPGEPGASAAFLSCSGECLDLCSAGRDMASGTEKTSYVFVFICPSGQGQLEDKQCRIWSCLFFLYLCPTGVTSGNLPQLGNTSISLCTAWGNLPSLGQSLLHLQNPEKKEQRLQSCPGLSPLAAGRELSPEAQVFLGPSASFRASCHSAGTGHHWLEEADGGPVADGAVRNVISTGTRDMD